MKKKLLHIILVILVAVGLTGCKDRLDLEDVIFPLGIGIDLDKDNNLLLYDIHPVFSKNVKKKNQEIVAVTSTLRQGKADVDSFTSGVFLARKVLIVLISRKILQNDGWFRMLDVYFRDTKNPLTPRIVTYDGPLSDIVFINPEDAPMLPLMLRGMIDTKSARSETVSTTLQELHWQMYERGITPSISEVGVSNDGDVVLIGSALLNHRGLYTATLGFDETVLLNILQKNARKTISISLPVPGESKQGPFATNLVSFSAERIITKIKTSYRQNKFVFDIHIQMPVVLTELLFPFDVAKNGAQLEQILDKQTQKQFEALIKKIQNHKIDPVGLGRYARAYNYSQFKKIEHRWGEELAKADIHVTVDITIQGSGTVK